MNRLKTLAGGAVVFAGFFFSGCDTGGAMPMIGGGYYRSWGNDPFYDRWYGWGRPGWGHDHIIVVPSRPVHRPVTLPSHHPVPR